MEIQEVTSTLVKTRASHRKLPYGVLRQRHRLAPVDPSAKELPSLASSGADLLEISTPQQQKTA